MTVCEFCTIGTGLHHPDCESPICLKYQLVMQKERHRSEARNKLLRTDGEWQPEEDYDLSTPKIDADPHREPQ